MNENQNIKTYTLIFITSIIKMVLFIFVLFKGFYMGATFSWGGGWIFLFIFLFGIIWIPYLALTIIHICLYRKCKKQIAQNNNSYKKTGITSLVMAMISNIIFYTCATIYELILCLNGNNSFMVMVVVFLLGFVEFGIAIVSIVKMSKKQNTTV